MNHVIMKRFFLFFSLPVVARLFGGQGTLNVNSWAPDSRRLAFVGYRPE
jgi:hypothetical protein